MNFQNDRYTLRLALPEDDAGIRAVFESASFSGGLSIQYLRPSPLRSFAADGDDVKMLVVRDNENGRIAAAALFYRTRLSVYGHAAGGLRLCVFDRAG